VVAFQKFNTFQQDLLLGVHRLAAAGDVVKACLTNTAPVATNTVKANITEITAQFGYPAGGSDILNDVTLSGAVGQLIGTDVTWTASGGSFGPFRYVVIYNDTQTTPAKPLIGWYDYGSAISVNDTESFNVDFGATVLTLT
jgi:hypothetical protein